MKRSSARWPSRPTARQKPTTSASIQFPPPRDQSFRSESSPAPARIRATGGTGRAPHHRLRYSPPRHATKASVVNPAQLLLEYQRLVERERALRDDIARVESRLESDPEVVAREETLEGARSSQQAVAAQLREFDHEREGHRSRLRTREKELMSGRIRNPTELMQMSEEVQHMKTRFAGEGGAQLHPMEDAEAADEAFREATASLEEARKVSGGGGPGRKEGAG